MVITEGGVINMELILSTSVRKENDMGYYSSNAYRDLKWFEKMSKEANVGKRDFKQINKIHRRNKMKKRK